ncbi:MAG: carbohydrate ABC transporter permease [Treponema sp.]|jgi:putative aldouronate transport system permease protein|nr:carbohydrate ABC transporter permease [Treponema sp.]
MIIRTKKAKIGDLIVAAICLGAVLLCILPMINLLAQSLSSSQSVINNKVKFIPVVYKAENHSFRTGATLESYRYVFLDKDFTRSMWWTAILTIICTLVSLAMTILCAYPLTYGWLRGKGLINTIIIFTMYFNAGTIPNYILMRSLGLLNNPLVLIIPNCLSVFNMIILRSFFFGIPDSLRESAEIDGANPFTVLTRIYLPLSGPVLATLSLFYAVGRWNGFGDALLYINRAPQWVPIQLKLWQLIQDTTSIDFTTVEMVAGNIPIASDAIKAAAIMFATVPILIVYPWLQRYFIAGVTIGAVKG